MFTSSSADLMSVTHTASNPSSPKTGYNLNEITSDTASPSIIERDSPAMLCHPPNSPVGTSLILAMLSSIPTSPGDCQVISTIPWSFSHCSTSPSFTKWLCQIGSSMNL